MNQISNRDASQAQQWIRIRMEKALNDAEIQKRFSEIGLNRAQAQRLVTLLPSELENLDSQTLVNNETAALTFLKQGTEAIIRAKYRSDINKQDVEIKRLNAIFETEKAFLDSLKSDDGEISTVEKHFSYLNVYSVKWLCLFHQAQISSIYWFKRGYSFPLFFVTKQPIRMDFVPV